MSDKKCGYCGSCVPHNKQDEWMYCSRDVKKFPDETDDNETVLKDTATFYCSLDCISESISDD